MVLRYIALTNISFNLGLFSFLSLILFCLGSCLGASRASVASSITAAVAADDGGFFNTVAETGSIDYSSNELQYTMIDATYPSNYGGMYKWMFH